ncbi:DNA primase, partial [Leptolyngbya sp. FACHB-711]
AFGAEKLWYVANDHRNPTTGTVETNYTDLTVRHKGLKQDFSRKTPNGNPILRHPRTEEGEEPDTAPNCYRTDLFRVFSEKGYNVEGSKNSPICGTCKLAHLCSQGIGGKYGATFRGDRQQALASDRIRAHADSLPIPGTEEGFDYSNSGLFWDEIGSNLKPIKETRVSLQDFDRTFAELESKAPDLHELLKPQRLALRSLLTGEVKQPYHGFDDAAIRNLLPNLSPENSEELIEIVAEIVEKLRETLTPDLDFLNNDPDSITNDEIQEPGISKSMQRLVNREFKREAHREFFEELKNLPLNWLVPFVRVWTRFERGAFRLEGNQLIIFTHNPKYSDIAASARFNIYLDATITRERLALLLGVDKSEIYVVGQETPNHGNLKLIQVTGMGKLGKNRSKSLEQRVAALRKALEARYPGIVFGDWKSQASQGDGQWFVNLRGSNEFKDAPAMAVVGVPYPNVGYLQVLYQTLTGEYAPLNKETPHEGLQRFIEAHVEAEIEQAVGRLRSHLRPNEQLTFLFVGDYDLSFLGMPVEQVEAFQICPEAGTDAQVTRWQILEAVRLLHSQSQKLTQVAIATLIGKSQELVSKIASEFGGWKRLKKILLVLLNPPSSGSNIFSGLTDDEKWLAQIYLPACLDDHPQDAVEQIAQLVQLYGMKQFLRLLSAATPQTQVRLLALLLQSLSLPFHTELVALLVGGA